LVLFFKLLYIFEGAVVFLDSDLFGTTIATSGI
jgi:hypothetical protein